MRSFFCQKLCLLLVLLLLPATVFSRVHSLSEAAQYAAAETTEYPTAEPTEYSNTEAAPEYTTTEEIESPTAEPTESPTTEPTEEDASSISQDEDFQGSPTTTRHRSHRVHYPSETAFMTSENMDAPTPTPTPMPTPSCALHNQDPDQGINQAFCLCDGSITLSPLPATSAQSESCAYQSIPGSTDGAMETVTTATKVWTDNCAACTIVGGIADQQSCTSVSGCTPTGLPPAAPTIAAFLANLTSIDIGIAANANNGKDLAKEMYNKLKAMCGPQGCKSDHAEMDNVETIIAMGVEPLKPAMFLQTATYVDFKDFQQMLSVGISTWISALNNADTNLCQQVTYEADADMTGSGCGKGPISRSLIRRKIRRDDGYVLWERPDVIEERKLAERCSSDSCGERPGSGKLTCHYSARTCLSPSEITVIKHDGVNPYGQFLSIGLTQDSTGNGFNCEAAVEAITIVMSLLAPELAGEEVLEGIQLAAMCGLISNPQGTFSNMPKLGKVAGHVREISAG